MKGRARELATLARLASPQSKLALVGTGGSGKSMLACALGHRVKKRFPGGLHWFRSGPWDVRTLGEMLAIRFRTSRERKRLFPALRRFFADRPPTFVVLDNHENDLAIARLFGELGDARASWIITARRCLLGGIYVYPIIAPLSTGGEAAFPRVRALTQLLRHNPLALDIADAIVRSGAISVRELRAWLVERGVDTVRVIDHEDDLPEVALLLAWAWERLDAPERRALAVLAHTGGDHLDEASVLHLARAPSNAPAKPNALARLRAFHLVQSPFPGRYALHAVVRHAVAKRTTFDPNRMHGYYLDLLEREPHRLDLEQTHLYAAMDHAHTESSLDSMLRIERLLARFDPAL
jgi:hypothetical protein